VQYRKVCAKAYDWFGAHFCALRAKSNASWNENFIQHCKMQEAATLASGILLRPTEATLAVFPGVSVRRAHARLRPLRAPVGSNLTGK
jgi:hypothetical protein